VKDEAERRVPYRSEIEAFVNTPVWKYIAEEISIMMVNAASDNDELDPYKDAAVLCRNQGLVKFGKMILDMPAQMAEEFDEQAANDAKQRTEEEKK
jgi:hypothetical protein